MHILIFVPILRMSKFCSILDLDTVDLNNPKVFEVIDETKTIRGAFDLTISSKKSKQGMYNLWKEKTHFLQTSSI